MYAAQDEINQSELTVSELEINLNDFNVPRWPYRLMFPTLTPQQWKILNMALTGLSYSEIAQTLDTSRHTVEVQVYSLRRKLNKTT